MLDYLILFFFCFRIWPGRNNSSQTMSAAECFINFLHNHSAQESHQVQSTLQLSLVQHKERQNSPFPCLSSISKPHISPQKLPAAQGVFTHSSSLATRMKEGPGLRGQLQVKLAIFPGFDMPRHLIFYFFPQKQSTLRIGQSSRGLPQPIISQWYWTQSSDPSLTFWLWRLVSCRLMPVLVGFVGALLTSHCLQKEAVTLKTRCTKMSVL